MARVFYTYESVPCHRGFAFVAVPQVAGVCDLTKIASCGTAANAAIAAAALAKDNAQCTKAITDYTSCVGDCA